MNIVRFRKSFVFGELSKYNGLYEMSFGVEHRGNKYIYVY